MKLPSDVSLPKLVWLNDIEQDLVLKKTCLFWLVSGYEGRLESRDMSWTANDVRLSTERDSRRVVKRVLW
jgi:hypothetical protein